jgi:hypothetical protein
LAFLQILLWHEKPGERLRVALEQLRTCQAGAAIGPPRERLFAVCEAAVLSSALFGRRNLLSLFVLFIGKPGA